MNAPRWLQYVLIFLLSLAMLTGCGSSSSSGGDDGEISSNIQVETNSSQIAISTPNSEVNNTTNLEENQAVETKTKGYLIDSPLSGVTYECDGNEGLTDNSGMFECVASPVVFKIGGLTLGTLTEFTADGKVYPQDLLGLDRDNFSDSRLKLLTRLMQSLDDDGDINTKITITTDLRAKLTDVQDFKDMSLGDIEALLSGLEKSLVSESDALKHLKDSLGIKENVNSLVGGGGASSSGSSSNPKIYQKSISIKTTTNKIVAYELQIHCLDNLPSNSNINIAPDEISSSGRVVTILGVNIDESKQNIKIAVASSGTEDGTNFISKAVEFNGCTDAIIINEIVVDSFANKIDNPEILISE